MAARLSRRRLLQRAALAAPALGLAACGAPVLSAPPGIARKPVTLNLYYGPFFIQGGGQSPEDTAMASVVERYQKGHPNVTLNAVALTQSVFQGFSALLDPSSPTHADVYLGQFVGRFGQLNLQDAITPVDGYLKREKAVTAADFYPAAMHLWWREGKQLGLPRDIQPNDIIYYNRDLLKAAGLRDPNDGWTTDDFLKYLAQAQAAGRDLPATNPQHWAYVDIDVRQGFLDFVYLFGGRISSDPGSPARATFDTSQAIEGAQFYVDLVLKYQYAPDRLRRVSAYSLNPIPEFLLGHVPLILAPSNLIATMQSVKHPLDWDVTLEPIKPDVKQSWYGGGLGLFLTRAGGTPDEAWEVVKDLAAGEGMKERAAKGDVHPACRKIAESGAYGPARAPLGKRLFNSVGMAQLIDFDPSTLPAGPSGTPVPGSTPDYNAMTRYVADNLDDALTGKVDIAQVMRDATARANAALRAG